MKVMCSRHFTNAWFGRLSTSMIDYLKMELEEDIENIDAMSMVHLSAEIVISANVRCDCLKKNYAKASRNIIKAHIEECHLMYFCCMRRAL